MKIFMDPRGKKSQVAVILTFVIALLMLFAIAFVNVAKVSDMKTLTAIAADKACLSLGSSLGAIGKAYKDSLGLGPGETKKCDKNPYAILAVVLIIAAVVVTIVTLGADIPVLLAIAGVGVGLGLGVGGALSAIKAKLWLDEEGLSRLLGGMTTFSALREGTLYSAANGVVSDFVMVRRVGGDPGTYYDSSTGITFDLHDSAIFPTLQKKNPDWIPRFSAWYYGVRARVVSEGSLAGPINNFIGGLMGQMYFNGTDWNQMNWQYEKLTFPVAVSGITSNPEWILPNGQINLLGPVDINGNANWLGIKECSQIDGFFNDKFRELCHRIVDKLGSDRLSNLNCPEAKDLNFISSPGFIGIGKNDAPIDALVSDLRDFQSELIKLANIPVSTRINTINTWLKPWYDFEQHPDGKVTNDGSYDHDMYQRAYRIVAVLNSWIERFEEINTVEAVQGSGDGGLRHRIETAEIISSGTDSKCWVGRGEPVDQCYIELNPAFCEVEESCGENCTQTVAKAACDNLQYVTWKGIYGTCTGDGKSHTSNPVCQIGDLYGDHPDWCDNPREVLTCVTTSECPGRSCIDPPPIYVKNSNGPDPAFYFQGQEAWNNTAGPTEVEQANDILIALRDKMVYIRDSIKALGEEVNRVMNENSQTKEEFVYAWNDIRLDVQPPTDKGNYHMVRVYMVGYPAVEMFPSVTVDKPWWTLGLIPYEVCKEIKGNVTGNVQLYVERYDTDLPGFWWNIRRRTVGGSGHAMGMGFVQDVMSDGIVGDRGTLGACASSAIASGTDLHYGPSKQEIYITRLK